MNPLGRFMFPCKGNRRTGKHIGRVLFVDPGLGGTGWALFDPVVTYLPSQVRREQLKPNAGYVDSGVYHSKGRQWEGRARDVCSWFAGLIKASDVNIVVLEMPSAWSNSVVSMSSVTSGDLFKLTYLVGGLAQVASQQGCNLPVLVKPGEWKGQLPKQVVINRIKIRLPHLHLGDHEADAVGMGMAAQGLL